MFFTKVTALALLGYISAGVVISPPKPDGCVQIHPDCNPKKCVTLKVVYPHKPEHPKVDGHKGDGYKPEYPKNDGHKGDGYKGDGYKGDGHKGDGYKPEYPKNDGHKGDGYKGDGHKGDGYKGDGHKGDGYKGDGHKGDGYKGDGHKGDGQDYGHKGDAQKWRRWNTPPPPPTYEVVIEECCGSPEQDWIVKDSFIKSAAPDLWDLCVTGTPDAKGLFLNGGKIGVNKCDASDCGQAWCYDPKYKTFILKDKNVALDLPGGKAFDGACLQQWQASPGNPNQVWKLS